MCDYNDEPKKFILNCFGINIFKAQVLSSLISPYWLPNCVRIKNVIFKLEDEFGLQRVEG